MNQMKRPTLEELVELWDLQDMVTENVLFTQSYAATRYGPDAKPLSTATIALLTSDKSSFSDMHRLPTDELWHFYLGDPIELLLLYPNGKDELVILGHDVLNGQRIQKTVPAAVWMGARVRPGGEYGVFGNTMAPGYVLSDFEGANAAELCERWPHRTELIMALIRSDAPSQKNTQPTFNLT